MLILILVILISNVSLLMILIKKTEIEKKENNKKRILIESLIIIFSLSIIISNLLIYVIFKDASILINKIDLNSNVNEQIILKTTFYMSVFIVMVSISAEIKNRIKYKNKN